MEAVTGKLAVPFTEGALARAIFGNRQRLALHPGRRFHTRDGCEGCRQIDLFHRLFHSCRLHVLVWRWPPDERQAHQRIDMPRAFINKPEITPVSYTHLTL